MNRNDLIVNGVERVVEIVIDLNIALDTLEIDEDLLNTVRINGVTIESDDELHHQMISLLDDELVDEIIDGVECELGL